MSDTIVRPKSIQLYESPEQTLEALRQLQEKCNVLFPITRVDMIPVFYQVSLRIVPVSLDLKTGGEIYAVTGSQGKYALTKVALTKISNAAEVNWWPTVRNDDGSDPYYCSMTAMGYYLALTGNWRLITATKEIDLRDSGAMIAEIDRNARKDSRDPMNEILQARKHIVSQCEAKARNRALREAFSIHPAYTMDELTIRGARDGEVTPRPFVVPALALTGYHPDPRIQEMFLQRQADKALSGAAALFGGGFDKQAEEFSARPKRRPPAVDFVGREDDDEPVMSHDVGDDRPFAPPPVDARPSVPPPAEERRREEPAREPRAGAQEDFGLPGSQPAPARAAGKDSSGGDGFFRFGKSKGKNLHEVPESELRWYAGAFESSLDDPSKARFHDATRTQLDALRAEAKRRGIAL